MENSTGTDKQFIVFLVVAYVYIVKIGGPRFMKGRKPYDSIKPLIVLYNAAMVLLNCYFVGAFYVRTYGTGRYSLFCQGIDFQARDALTMSMLSHVWWYVMVRIADFLDTIFFVLRKKDSHISFLHVVHHVLVVFNGWFGLAYGADGHAAFGIIFNSFVHVVMYSYYFPVSVGTLGAEVPLVEAIPHPVPAGSGVFFFTMFMNFYIKSYCNRRRGPQHREEIKIKDQ
ncbi:hypothetical protein MRX96_037033 [Rhipicephalus microplus]